MSMGVLRISLVSMKRMRDHNINRAHNIIGAINMIMVSVNAVLVVGAGAGYFTTL